MTPKIKTYTNRKPHPMILADIKAKHGTPEGPMHTFTLQPGESRQLYERAGVRRVWKNPMSKTKAAK